ncbi:MAG: hypothetical protein JSW27_21310 [Phycisphaerales bacterium]|nr:MAG: hypothetical protein JSW27_21310 [Phycisphaerales bacterium]
MLYIVFLSAIAAVPPLATDMYLAAMPTIAVQWGVPDSHVALSLVLWFAGFIAFYQVHGRRRLHAHRYGLVGSAHRRLWSPRGAVADGGAGILACVVASTGHDACGERGAETILCGR